MIPVLENQNKRVKIDISRLRRVLAAYLSHKKSLGPIDIAFVTDRKIAAFAGKFRGSPYSTDVLSFAYNEADLTGEIAISLDTAKRQALKRRVPLMHEVILLCVHGLLHIEGFDDESYDDFCEMKKKEFEAMMRIL